MRTRVFKSGNSQAVRIPSELAYGDGVSELTITRTGDVIIVFPQRQDLKAAVAALRALPTPPAEDRSPVDLPDRGAR